MLRRASLLIAALAASAGAVPIVPEELPVAEPLEALAPPRRARAPEPASAWAVSFGRDRRGSSASINYRLRWDFDDVRRSPETLLRHLQNPLDSFDFTLRGLAEETRVDLYGVHMKPFRGLFHAPLPGGTTAAYDGLTVVGVVAAARQRRRWYDVDPLVKELERGARRDARRFLIKSAFDSALPSASGAPLWQKEAVAGGLLDIGRSTLDLP